MDAFNLFMLVMSIVALFVFISLFFVKAGYGIFVTPAWGPAINNRLAWVLMECPVFLVMLAFALCSSGQTASWVFFFLFQAHYFQRSFIFPFLMKGKSKMPVSVVLMGVVFNILNGLMNGLWIFYIYRDWGYDYSAVWLLQPWFIAGVAVFFVGMLINLHSDHIIRNLRKEGDSSHHLPKGGMFNYVTSANYFGEIVEWCGFALLTLSPAALVFAWWTFANLVPRAAAIHERYIDEFGAENVPAKKIFPFVY